VKYQNVIVAANPTEIRNSDLGLTQCKIESTINIPLPLVLHAKRYTASPESKVYPQTPSPELPGALPRVEAHTAVLPARTYVSLTEPLPFDSRPPDATEQSTLRNAYDEVTPRAAIFPDSWYS
jgi:hypothetical protein